MRDDVAARAARARTHFDDRVRFGEDLRVVVDEHYGVPVRHEVVHDVRKPLYVRGVQTDGRLVQHVQHARRAVAYRPRELRALTLARGQRARRAIEREVSQPKVDEPRRGGEEGLAYALRHGTHFGRQAVWHAAHPFDDVGQRHAAGLVQTDAAQAGSAGGGREPRSAAIGTDVLFEEFLHAFHAALVLDLRKRVYQLIPSHHAGKVGKPH